MSGRMFLDSNVLVYAYDSALQSKRAVSQKLLLDGVKTGNCFISAQVMAEFFVVVTRKIAKTMSIDEADSALNAVGLQVVDVDASLVRRAIELCRNHQLSYWDAQIVAAAERARCETILSEDLNPGQLYAGIKVVNPFHEAVVAREPRG